MSDGRAPAAGRWLYRHRSFTAVPLIAAILYHVLSGGVRRVAVPPGLEAGLDWLAVLLVGAGCLVRWRVLGQAPASTSGRGRRLEARVLMTRGLYARMRNPLYFGNLLICLGLCLEVRSVAVAGGVLLFFWLQYALIIRAEEAFLQARFGADFEAWRARVPRFWPRWRVERTETPVMHWRRALLRDADTWFAALGSLLLWRWWLGDAAPAGPGTASSWFGALAGAYLGVKLIKRRNRKHR